MCVCGVRVFAYLLANVLDHHRFQQLPFFRLLRDSVIYHPDNDGETSNSEKHPIAQEVPVSGRRTEVCVWQIFIFKNDTYFAPGFAFAASTLLLRALGIGVTRTFSTSSVPDIVVSEVPLLLLLLLLLLLTLYYFASEANDACDVHWCFSWLVMRYYGQREQGEEWGLSRVAGAAAVGMFFFEGGFFVFSFLVRTCSLF